MQLQELTITAQENPLINAGRTGAAQTISERAIRTLPLQGRNFTDLIATSPQATPSSSSDGAITIAGQNNRYNNIQIDGGINTDLFAIGSTGAPGGQVLSKPISLEAVQEFQVLVAPFDVRQGNFAGGLVNAITKSGTNRFSGSVFSYYRNDDLTGDDPLGNPATEFKQWQYGLTFGGPILRDRVHFFAAVDVQEQDAPFGGQQIGPDPTNGADSLGIGITQLTATRVQEIVRDQYGFDPGDWRQPTLGQPDRNLFGKVTAQLGREQPARAVLQQRGRRPGADHPRRAPGRRPGPRRLPAHPERMDPGQQHQHRSRQVAHGVRRQVEQRAAGGLSAHPRQARPGRRTRRSSGCRPTAPASYVAAGSDVFTPGNFLDQDIYEVTDNVTFDVGSSHRVTVGTHNEFFSFFNGFFPAEAGRLDLRRYHGAQGQHPEPLHHRAAAPRGRAQHRLRGAAARTVRAGRLVAQRPADGHRRPPRRRAVHRRAESEPGAAHVAARDQHQRFPVRQHPLVAASRRQLRSRRPGYHDSAWRRGSVQRPPAVRVDLERVRQYGPRAGAAHLQRGRARCPP